MAIPTAEAISGVLGEPRSRTELVLENIALRQQIAVLKRNGTRRPCFRSLGSAALDLAVVVLAALV